MISADVSGIKSSDGCFGLSSDGTAPCVNSIDVKDTGDGNINGLAGECRNLIGVGLEEVLDYECGVSGVCFNESRGEIGDCNTQDGCLGLSQDGNNICLSSANFTEIIGGDRDGSGCGCENMACSVLEKLEDDEHRVCPNESQSEVDFCCAESNGFCLEKRRFQGDGIESLENCNFPLDEMPRNSSPRNCDQQHKQMGHQEVNLSSAEGIAEAVEAMGEEIDVLAEVKACNGNQTFSSEAGGMPLESMSVTSLPENCVQQHGQKDDNMIEKTDALLELEKDPDQILSSQSSEILSELKPKTLSPRNCVEQDDQNDDRSTSRPSSEGSMEGFEERSNSLDGVERVTCDQILTLECCEMPSELLSMTGSSINSVAQDDKKNDNSVGCPFSKGDMQGMEEKTNALAGIEKVTHEEMLPSQCCETSTELIHLSSSPQSHIQRGNQKNVKNVGSPSFEGVTEITEGKTDTCDCTLPLQGCAMPTELSSGTCSLRYYSQQNEQKGDEGISFPSLDEVTEERRDVIGKIENDIFHPRSPSQPIELSTELVSSTGLSSVSAQQNEQKGTESTSYSAVEGKASVPAVTEAIMCNCVSTLQGGEMSLKVCCEGESISCDGHNEPMVHERFSHLTVETTVEAMETKGNTDTCIAALPVQGCQSSLESIHITDSLGNFSRTNEQGKNKTVDGPLLETVTEDVEEKSDVSTDVKVEISCQVSPMEESLKEHSSGVGPDSLQSCQPFVVGENSSCNSLEVADLAQKDGFIAISSSNAVDSYGQVDHEIKDNVGVVCFPETKSSNIASSSSRRSRRTSKSSRRTQTKRAARSRRTTAKVQHSHGSIDIIVNVARRKRSCFSKPARSSIWGLLGSITQIFSDSDVSSFSLAQSQGSQKARGGKGSQKQNKNRVGGSTPRSSRKLNASTRGLRLKVKLGNKICQSSLNFVVPEVVETTGSDDAVVGAGITESFPVDISEFPTLAQDVEDKLGEEGTEQQFQCLDRNLEEILEHPDDSVLDVHLADNNSEDTVIDKSAGDVADNNLEIITHEAVEVFGVTENNYVDPGTSPDSEVINSAPDAELGARSQEALHKIALTSSEASAGPRYVTAGKRGKKKANLPLVGNTILEDSAPVAATVNKAKQPKKRGGRQKSGDVIQSDGSFSALPGTNASSNSSSGEEYCGELLPSSRDIEPGIIGETTVLSIKSKVKSDGTKKGKSKVSNAARNMKKYASSQGVNQQKAVNMKKVKEKGVPATKRRVKGVREQVEDKTLDQQQIGIHIADDIGNADSGNNSASFDEANMENISGGELGHYIPPESAWVRCDECYKWRRIPFSLLELIDEHCRWVCKDNMDKAFADCSIPQEKSNEDINAELGLSDFEEDDSLENYDRLGNGLDSSSTAVQPGSWFRRIDSNVFLHRSRKTQTIDEVMVCHCKPPSDGGLGCGEECLNRMLNIECVQGTCPCGDFCSNQQFQKRKYANMQWHRYGKKGFGLVSLEDILTGKFIIEYVGEVLDMQAYEARQKEYAANGHKHFYFMTLNGSEVIDACAKGNLGRFINHSCDPNCRTEKWMVNGEICIGLFAMRDIKQGEELTFDYNYVRVFGAAAKKCHCGSPQCRGYIGGDPQNTEIIYQGDSDDEYPEPVMLEEHETEGAINKVSKRHIAEAVVKDRNKVDYSTTAIRKLELTKVENFRNQTASAISSLKSSSEMEDSKGKYPSLQTLEISLQAEDITSIPVCAVQQEVSKQEEIMKETSALIPPAETSPTAMVSGKSFLDGSDSNRKSKSDTVEDNQGISKSRPRIKTSRKAGSIKKGKGDSSPLNGNKVKMMTGKTQIFSIKPKKITEGSSNGRFEAVQEKLNELLDADGGINKRKDAPKGYLKLLLLTAASGDSSNGEAIQGNRDLSMILDALLKTKSRVVLMDIINKNGLQMLHNMIKQYRRDFKKIPILRKLLKVLEYLAMREILTRNHITAGPPCPGMESFRESILSLTEHDDKQVHQIARSFRDRWIPKPIRKHSYMDRDDGRLDILRGLNCSRPSVLHNHWRDQGLRPSVAVDCVIQSSLTITMVDTTSNEVGSSPSTGGCQTIGSKTRKRKSRWDQPAKTNLKEPKLESRLLPQHEPSPFPKRGEVVPDHTDKMSRDDSSYPDCIHNHNNHDDAVNSEDGGQNMQEDAPPGFSSPLNPPLVSSDASSTTDLPQQNFSHLGCPFDVAIAHPQGKFNNRLPVSYGIPLHILSQFGSPQAETVDRWVIAPGMPFHPFPPLPPFPCEKKDTPTGCAVGFKTGNGSSEEWPQDSNRPPNCNPEENNPSTTGTNQSAADIPGVDAQQTFKRMRGSSNDLGRRYFRQQKRKGPPWLWRRNELRNSYCSQDVSCRVDKPVGNFYQRPPQQNHH
ncbi:histone-lysine N-methyltransferase ASHH2-like [Melia azedarach]|uniref:Histone-lysine N-methyltransferase ASHH2-like n=1 Tax=Melia azedarach TaxID=155640 RepID=A0ACC1WNP0_MELAZ|nr:histone-lysine N-methyltransferase ASHH2-like [Melia azedarach]